MWIKLRPRSLCDTLLPPVTLVVHHWTGPCLILVVYVCAYDIEDINAYNKCLHA